MPTLVSPGVSVSVIDESFYGAAGLGTVPLLIIATGKDKSHPGGTGTASGTTGTTETLSLITSQRELLQTYGNPYFREVSGTQVHGDNMSEYGLLAAHSYLGIANRAYILRAGVNLTELVPSGTAPVGEPTDGTYWVDMTASNIGVFSYNATTATWVAGTVHELNSADEVDAGTGEPLNSVGLDGEFAWVAVATGNAHNRVYQKISGDWKHLGTTVWATAASADFQFASHTAIPTTQSGGAALQTGDVFIKTTQYNSGTEFKVKLYNASTNQWVTHTAPALSGTAAAWTHHGSPVAGDLYVKYNHEASTSQPIVASHQVLRHNGATTLAVTGSSAIGTGALTTGQTIVVNGTTVTYTSSADADAVRLAAVISTAAITDITASVSSSKIVITNTAGKDIVLAAGATGTLLADANLTAGTSSNFEVLSYEPNLVEPVGVPADGALWYDSRITTIDMLETYDNAGSTDWRTFSGTLSAASSAPTAPSSGDLWVDTTDTENYPGLHRYNGTTTTWDAIDVADQTTSAGIVFGNFRATAASALETIAPVAATYPVGLLGWNFMASGYDVKKYNATDVKWFNESGLQTDGSMWAGRHAQKKVVVTSMAAAISSNTEIRAETRFFNLICAPGHGTELLDEMKTLNVDRKETAFIIGDTPFRLGVDSTAIKNWSSNFSNAAENGETGLVTSGFDIGLWYPGGNLTTNITGDNVVQPSSHIMLRSMAYNDQVAYEWFAPAGFNRGLVNNATSVGYIDGEGEYKPVVLNPGQRDVLYANKINPIAFMPGRGLVVFGQKTLHTVTSALDRVNVSRLVAFLRRRFDEIAQPFLFEPNDGFTRDQVAQVFNAFMGDMVTKRGVYDYLVICDESNNTNARIDRNELWIDVAVQPVKAIEFIYIPIRIRNTGESLTIAGTA